MYKWTSYQEIIVELVEMVGVCVGGGGRNITVKLSSC